MANGKTDEKGIREIRPGVWEVRFHVGTDPVTSKVVQLSRTVQATRPRSGNLPRAVVALRDELRSQLPTLKAELAAKSADVVPAKPETVGQLLDEWLAHGLSRGRSPNTLAGYRYKIESAIRPALGAVRLEALTAHDLDRWYTELSQTGTSPAMILHYHRVLSAALNQGVKWDLLNASPVTKATPPPVIRPEMNVPPPERVRALIELAAESKSPELAAIITLAALTGLRRGELVGLRWSDVDWAESTITIRRSIWQTSDGWGAKDPKSHQIRRLILGGHAMAVLRGRCGRAAQDAEFCETPLTAEAYIFSPDADGDRPLMLHSITQGFMRLCRKAEQPALDRLRETSKKATRADLPIDEQWAYRFHDLRHYTATEMFRAGVNPRTVADRLGHADPSITLRIYVANTDDQARDAANLLEAGLTA